MPRALHISALLTSLLLPLQVSAQDTETLRQLGILPPEPSASVQPGAEPGQPEIDSSVEAPAPTNTVTPQEEAPEVTPETELLIAERPLPRPSILHALTLVNTAGLPEEPAARLPSMINGAGHFEFTCGVLDIHLITASDTFTKDGTFAEDEQLLFLFERGETLYGYALFDESLENITQLLNRGVNFELGVRKTTDAPWEIHTTTFPTLFLFYTAMLEIYQQPENEYDRQEYLQLLFEGEVSYPQQCLGEIIEAASAGEIEELGPALSGIPYKLHWKMRTPKPPSGSYDEYKIIENFRCGGVEHDAYWMSSATTISEVTAEPGDFMLIAATIPGAERYSNVLLKLNFGGRQVTSVGVAIEPDATQVYQNIPDSVNPASFFADTYASVSEEELDGEEAVAQAQACLTAFLVEVDKVVAEH